MATQTSIPQTLRKPAVLRKALRQAIIAERTTEKVRDTAKEKLKIAAKDLKEKTAGRRSIEDELEQATAAAGEEF